MPPVTVVIPAYNEAESIGKVIGHLRDVLAQAQIDAEILVVSDGATDSTASVARACRVRVIEHAQNLGYGRSLKTGILAATHDLIVITDADGTYPVERIPEMVKLSSRFHMVVGARTGAFYHGGMVKRVGRWVFRWLSEFAAGQQIPDINSGLRIFRRQEILPFFPVISSGFSFTTTTTLVYLLNDSFVHYLPIDYHQRAGKSKVRHFRDALRALQIIVEAILRCNPIKIFLLLAFPIALCGIGLVAGGLFLHCWVLGLSGVLLVCTSLNVLSMGFHAISVASRTPVAHPLPPGLTTTNSPEVTPPCPPRM